MPIPRLNRKYAAITDQSRSDNCTGLTSVIKLEVRRYGGSKDAKSTARTAYLDIPTAVDSHIVHNQALWPRCCVIGITRPVPADCDVEQNKKRMIKHPS